MIQFLCPIVIWLMMTWFFTAVCFAFVDGIELLNKLHRIPCDRCYYFTGHDQLKCAVHPCTALTESAMNCPDFVRATPRPITLHKF
jgi:hypothetical protein